MKAMFPQRILHHPRNFEDGSSEQVSAKLQTFKEVLQGCEKGPNAEEGVCSDKGENSLMDNQDKIQENHSCEQCGAKLDEIGMNKESMGPVIIYMCKMCHYKSIHT